MKCLIEKGDKMSNTNTYIGMAIALFLSILTIYIVVREMIRSNIK